MNKTKLAVLLSLGIVFIFFVTSLVVIDLNNLNNSNAEKAKELAVRTLSAREIELYEVTKCKYNLWDNSYYITLETSSGKKAEVVVHINAMNNMHKSGYGDKVMEILKDVR